MLPWQLPRKQVRLLVKQQVNLKGAGEGVKTAGKVAKVAYKVATKEEVELEEKKKL